MTIGDIMREHKISVWDNMYHLINEHLFDKRYADYKVSKVCIGGYSDLGSTIICPYTGKITTFDFTYGLPRIFLKKVSEPLNLED